MIIFARPSSEFVFAGISCGIVVVSIIEPFYGIPLCLLIVCELLWQCFHSKKSLFVKFDKVHNCPSLRDETASMLLEEWPSPAEINFVRTASLYESSDGLPCHLIAYTTTNEVVAHACLTPSPNSDSKSQSKYVKMIRNGVPLIAVKNSAKIAGLDTTFLDDPGILNRTQEPVTHGPSESYLTSMLVKPEYRGHSLGKAICAHAVFVAKELGIATLVGGCTDNVLPFYQKMGVCRMVAPKRDDMPSIRLGNYMYLELNNHVLQRANSLIAKFTL